MIMYTVRLRSDRVMDLHQSPRDLRGCRHLDSPHLPLGQTRRTVWFILMFLLTHHLYRHRLSPKWTSGSLPISLSPSVVPSPVSSPMIPLTVPSPIATPATTEIEGFLTELGAQVKMQGD
ncbi:hypothetical protein Tco_0314660 [Tanacetum coccineum]